MFSTFLSAVLGAPFVLGDEGTLISHHEPKMQRSSSDFILNQFSLELIRIGCAPI